MNSTDAPSPLFDIMLMARALMAESPHAVNKIVAAIKGTDHQGLPYLLSRTNIWPEALSSIPHTVEIGDSAGWIHAEIAAILESPCTENASLFVTDPPCPNCMKNIIAAGISDIYVDMEGYRKEFAVRVGRDVLDMSINLAERAGVRLWDMDVEARSCTLVTAPPDRPPIPSDNPPLFEKIENISAPSFLAHIRRVQARMGAIEMATAFAVGPKGDTVAITVQPTLSRGLSALHNPRDEPYLTRLILNKYSFLLTALNRLLMEARKSGYRLILEHVYTNRVPTSRELVNFIGAGGRQLHIGHANKGRDEKSLSALHMLEGSGILKIVRVKGPEV